VAHGAIDDVADAKLRAICMAFPEAVEQPTWGRSTYRVRSKIFAMTDEHESAFSVWCKTLPDIQRILIAGDPAHFFWPPYVGPKGWVGIKLTGDVDWEQVEDLIDESYRYIAPKRLVAALDSRATETDDGSAGVA
jgi:predicted DNA-binding protein (MmcQ/YjbR family)